MRSTFFLKERILLSGNLFRILVQMDIVKARFTHFGSINGQQMALAIIMQPKCSALKMYATKG